MDPVARTDPDFTPAPSEPTPGRSGRWWRALAALGVLALVVAMLLPATRTAPRARSRMQCASNLFQIGLALRTYAHQYGALPPAATVDASGRPLHSWRTLILPYLDEGDRYRSIDLSKPWDDPANARESGRPLRIYRCPDSPGPWNTTTYLASCGADACLAPHAPRPFAEITDPNDATLMVVEAGPGDAIPWMQPTDADAALLDRFAAGQVHHSGGANALFADGTPRFLPGRIRGPALRALRTIAGGDSPDVERSLDDINP